MQEFIEAGVSRDHLKIINYIRMHLKAITLSDITTPNGRRITFDAWNVIGSNNLRSNYDWPRSPPIFTTRQKEIWQQALHRTFSVINSGNTCRDLRLTMRLGSWTDNNLIEKWVYHYDFENTRIYKKEGLAWKGFYRLPGPITRGGRWEVSEQEPFVRQKPQTANQIATMRHENSRLVLENHDAWIVEEPQVEETHLDPYQNAFFAGDEVQNPIDNAFRASLKCQRVLLDYYKLPEDKCAAIAEAIANGKAKAISDGSFRPIEKKGTSGFIITSGKTTENSYQGCNWVPGLENEQSAYRSELAGISGLLASLKIIVKKFKITSGSIEIGLDGESAKDQAEDDYFLKIQQSSFDVILDIRRRVKELPINIKWRWIKGHAREKGFRLNWWHLMNEKMDKLAKKFTKKQLDNNKERYTVRLWYEKWAFYVNMVTN